MYLSLCAPVIVMAFPNQPACPRSMDTSLLVMLRLVRDRLGEPRGQTCSDGAVAGRSLLRCLRPRVPRRYRWLSLLPLAVPRRTRFILEARGHAASKTGVVVSELIAAGAHPGSVFPGDSAATQTRSRCRRFIRFLVRLPQAVKLDLYLRLRAPRLADDEAAAIIGREAAARFFARHPWVCALIISDISPLRAIMAAGARRARVATAWWQDDFHHDTPPRLRFSVGVVLNSRGACAFSEVHPEAQVYRRSATLIRPMRSLPERPRIGVVVNGFFTASDSQIDVVLRALGAFGSDFAELRLHPRSKLSAHEFKGQPIRPRPQGELLEEFCEYVDLVVCGNTAAQLRLAALGVPVVHVGGMDSQGFDAYRFGHSGVVFAEERLSADTLKRAAAFYASEAYRRRLVEALSADVPPEAPSLAEFVREASR